MDIYELNKRDDDSIDKLYIVGKNLSGLAIYF